MTSNAIDRASIPMVPSLMLSATVLHPLSPVPKTGSRSEPNQEVLYSCLMTAQRINGNCLSRSTKIFLIFRSTRLLVTLFFCGTLLFPSDFTLLCGYTESFLFLSLSPIPTSSFFILLSLSLDPTTDIIFVAEQNSKMQRRRLLAAFPNRAAACSLTMRGVLLRRKMAKVEETVWRRRPRSSLFERVQTRGICGFDSWHTPPSLLLSFYLFFI